MPGTCDPLRDGFDAKEFASIYREHAHAVHRTASRLCGDELAADVVQETFVRLWRSPQMFDPERGSMRALLVSIARHVSLDMLRTAHSRRRREERHQFMYPVCDAADATARLIGCEDRERVARALEMLRPAQREAITIICYGSLTYRQGAELLGIPEGTMKSRIRVGLVELRRLLVSSEEFAAA